MSIQEKARHLESTVNWDYPGLAAGERTAAALVAHLLRPPRPRFRFEYENKTQVLDFLRAHYAGWKTFNPTAADKFKNMSLKEAQGPRALSQVAALGKAWWATGDADYGRAFERFYLESETGGMFNWGEFTGTQPSLELNAWFLLADCPGFSTEGRIAFLDHVVSAVDYAWDEATSQWTLAMLGPEGHNWYLHGMQALPFFGLLFPEFKRAPFLLKTGWSVIEEHLRGHYHPDGGARETALGYHNGNVHNLWDFYQLALRNGFPVTPAYVPAALNATRFLLRLAAPDGGLPSFGDGGHQPGGLVNSAAIAAALTGDAECKWVAEKWRSALPGAAGQTPGVLPEGAFWQVGLAGARAYERIRARPPATTSVLMPSTGYAAMRAGHGLDASYMAVAAAERGPIVTSHGHNDIFSVEVHAGGIRFLGEMGCAPYGDSPGRLYDESTQAHNCLTLRGEEQLPLNGEWRWKGQLRPAVTRWITEPTHDWFEGAHEGFYRYPERQTLIWRKIFFRKPDGPESLGWWILLDRVESNAVNDCEIYFHGCQPARLDGSRVWLEPETGPALVLAAPDEDTQVWEPIRTLGFDAYLTERKLDPRRTPCVRAVKSLVSGCFAWGLIPVRPGASAPALKRVPVTVNGKAVEPEIATGIEITADGLTERLLVHHKPFDCELAADGLSGWGFLIHGVLGQEGWTVRTVNTMADGAVGD